MNAPQLLDTLQARGATLEREGESLRVAPSRVLDDELRAAIRCNKSELLELLKLESASRTIAPPLPPLPPSLAGIPGIEYSTERGEWIRRIGDAVWRVPLATSRPLPAYVADLTASRAFLRAVRAVKVPRCLGLSEAETREYSNAVACLDCGIDPRAVCANVNSMATVTSVKSEREIEEC